MALPLFFDFTDCRIMDFCRQKNVCSNYLHALLVSKYSFISEAERMSTTSGSIFDLTEIAMVESHGTLQIHHRCKGGFL